MSTGELERLERLLQRALHEADQVQVDVQGGREALPLRLVEKQRSVRRRTVISVAASVLVVVVTASMVLTGLREEKESLPVGPAPGVTLSPSGLPVGLLVGKVDRTEPEARSTIRIVVRPNGTGTWNSGTVGDSTGDSIADYDVAFEKAAPGRADMTYHGDCFTVRALTLDFTVRGHTVIIEHANTTDCLIHYGLASDMAGTTMRILPLPPDT